MGLHGSQSEYFTGLGPKMEVSLAVIGHIAPATLLNTLQISGKVQARRPRNQAR